MHFVLTVFLISFGIIVTNANKYSSCPTPVVFQNFDLTKILGRWYEYARFDNVFETECKCFTTDYIAIDENAIGFINCCYLPSYSNETQKCDFAMNRATLIDPSKKEASFKYTRLGSPYESHVWIVSTDYDNYLIAQGCDKVSEKEEKEVFWILIRQKVLDPLKSIAVDSVLGTLDIDRSKILKQHQGDDVCKAKRPSNLIDKALDKVSDIIKVQ